MYEDLKHLKKCYTLTAKRAADMAVDDNGITVMYPSGNELRIPRQQVMDAISLLKRQGSLSVEEAFEIVNSRPATDRLLGILSALPGVTSDKRPRKLYYRG